MGIFKPVIAAVGAVLLASAVHAEPAVSTASPYGDLHWRQLGPFRGGWATMVEGVADQPDTFYFAAAGGGLWRTPRRGAHLGSAVRTWPGRLGRGGGRRTVGCQRHLHRHRPA